MKERPIIFSSPMVLAIIEGRKTMTRRVIKIPHGWSIPPARYQNGYLNRWGNDPSERVKCPYGQVEDRLWVRETYAMNRLTNRPMYQAEFDSTFRLPCGGWRASIHMPRSASRITLEITGVRVKRVQDISEDDAKAEGCLNDVRMEYKGMGGPVDYEGRFAINRFEELWDFINSKRGHGWEANPYVWVIEFRRMKP